MKITAAPKDHLIPNDKLKPRCCTKMGHNNSTQSPWFQAILKQTLLHITHLMVWQETCTGKRKGYNNTVQSNCCSLPERGSSQWGTSHLHPSFPGFSSFPSLWLLFCASLLSHHLNLFPISHLCMSNTSASARRGSLSLPEQASSTALAHYSHNDDREAKSATSTYQTGIVCW